MKITFTEMWEKLKKYLTVDKALEEGFSNGKYTAVLAKYSMNPWYPVPAFCVQ